MNPRNALRLLPLIAAFSLTGCLQDTASYAFPEKDHAITLIRNQTWFWLKTLEIDLIAIHLPECHEGIRIKDVPRASKLVLYQAPDDYAVPLHFLQMGKRFYAISTPLCQVQKMADKPPQLGKKLGEFVEKDGTFQFVAHTPGQPETKE